MDLPLALSYDDVLLIPGRSRISSRSEVILETQLTPKIKLNLPLISSNMDTVTGPEMAIALGKLGGLGVLPRFNTPAQQAEMVSMVKSSGVPVGAAIGIRPGWRDRSQALLSAGVDLLFIDVAHGHQDRVLDMVRQFKSDFPGTELVAGNVATYEGARDLFEAGADCVKVGIGPGTACITRIQTGFGVPQITAVMESARAAREFSRSIICDGGTKNSGDIVKGLAAGSHAVMAGSLFAGTDESPGELISKDGRQFKKYNGSASAEEKTKQLERLGQENISGDYLDHVEGVSALVPYKGPLEREMRKIIAGIRSGFSYAGAENLSELHRNARFLRITSQGMRESGYHDLILTSV